MASEDPRDGVFPRLMLRLRLWEGGEGDKGDDREGEQGEEEGGICGGGEGVLQGV